MMIRLVSLLVLLSVATAVEDEPEFDINHANRKFTGHYEDPGTPGKKPVLVHVVPHTHDDVGWLKTVDQYYYGSKDDIYKGGVQYILDTVVDQLVKDPSKTFIYVEIAFFKRWWEDQSEETRNVVKKLVKDKQFEFISAGYCMNDEASVHYSATIDQMSEGLRWLQANVGGPDYDVTPRIAWQIDPFGHSSAQAELSAQIGLEGMFFARMHYQDYDKRKASRDLEFNWQNSDGSRIFTGVLYRHYNAPPGYSFDRRSTDPPMVTNPLSPEYNLPERVEGFLEYMRTQASHYRSGNIMLTMGGDFCYQNAEKYFKNLDILMNYINADSEKNGFKMVYSTPSRYMDAVVKDIIGPMKNKTDDFFPYADGPHAYWTGYFTSRPTLKGYIRDANNVLQACKQIEAAVGVQKEGPTSEKLRLAMGVSQHHDAVTGTSKQHVAYDYSRRLADGQTDCEAVINNGLQKLTYMRHKFHSCRLLNESYCDATQNTGNYSSFTLVVYNPRAEKRWEYIRVPVKSTNYWVKDLVTGQYIDIEYVRRHPSTYVINPSSAPLDVVIQATLPGLGFTSFYFEHHFPGQGPHYFGRLLKSRPVSPAEDLVIEARALKVWFDSRTGGIKRITNKLAGTSGKTDTLEQSFMEYSSSTGDKEDSQPSGAYIFRPMNEAADSLGNPVLTDYIPGLISSEIWQTYPGSWISQVTRVYYDKLYIEIEWTVGPIPLDHGREIITRYQSSLSTEKTFYTDSNGREMMKRVLNKQPTWDLNVTEPIAGNYYPVTARATMVDKKKDMAITVLTDRSQGAASLAEGQMEFMLHRRILKDDRRGVAEALNETAYGHGLIARGTHRLYYTDIATSNKLRRIALNMFYKPIVGVTGDELPEVPTRSFLKNEIEDRDLNLLTMQALNNTALLVRLESMVPNGSEHMVRADLDGLFAGRKLLRFEELGLGADRPVARAIQTTYAEHVKHDRETIISLKPSQIRTFVLNFKPV